MADAGSPSPGFLDGIQKRRRLPTMQSVMIAALVLTLGIWLAAGYYFVEHVRVLEREASEVTQRYAAADTLLSGVRRDLDRAAITLRDALIDPKPALDRYRNDVDAALEAADVKLIAYEPVLDSESERRHVDRLRSGIQALRHANQDFLTIDEEQWRSSAASHLLDEVAPKRDAAIRVSDALQRLNRDAYRAQQLEIDRLHQAIHQRSWQTVLFGALAGIVIGLAATFRVGRLERQLRAQQQRDAANAAALRDLSTRLVNAQEEERQLIARELHDGVGQLLTALKLELGQAERRLEGAPLQDARTIADQAFVAVRDMSHLLHPPELQELGLVEAIKAYVETIRRRQDVDIEFSSTAIDPHVLAAIELAVYRIVQEGVTNVLRHAHARHCAISLAGLPGKVQLTITDDGVGFSQPAGRGARAGLGLVGIRERVTHAGGTLLVDSAPGRGTTVRAEFPVPGDAPSAGAVDGAPQLAPAH